MKKNIIAIMVLGILLISVSAFGEMKRFAWSKNPEEVLGYKLCIGSSSRNYDREIDVGNITTWAVNLSDTQLSYLAVKAYNDQEDGGYSAELVYVPDNLNGIIKKFYADLNNDGWQDILYIKNDGVYKRMASDPDGSVGEEIFVMTNFSPSSGWDFTKHLVMLEDMNKDGYPDIVGFGYSGVIAAYSIDGISFESVTYIIRDAFSYNNGWRIELHLRGIKDINSDGYPDIYGFGYSGVIVAYSIDGMSFEGAACIIRDAFSYNNGWRIEMHLRGFEDINNDGYPDIYGFGYSGVIVAYSIDGRLFESAIYVIKSFGYNEGWRIEKHPRRFGDINNDGYFDIYGLGHSGVITAYSIDGRLFESVTYIIGDAFCYNDSWIISDYREFVLIDSDSLPEIIGWRTDGTTAVSYQVNGYYFLDPIYW